MHFLSTKVYSKIISLLKIKNLYFLNLLYTTKNKEKTKNKKTLFVLS